MESQLGLGKSLGRFKDGRQQDKFVICAKCCFALFGLIVGPILFLEFSEETLGLEEDDQVTAAYT